MPFTTSNLACKKMVFTNPKRTWSRDTNVCVEPRNNMLHKKLILQYTKNSAHLTKKQAYANMVKGIGPQAKRVWASQSETVSNPNIMDLPAVGNILLCNSTYECDKDTGICKQTLAGTQKKQTCDIHCVADKYRCDNVHKTCVKDNTSSGTQLKSECNKTCFPKFSCVNGQCVRDDINGVPYEVCIATCKYKCNTTIGDLNYGECVKDSSSEYTLDQCRDRCTFGCSKDTGQCVHNEKETQSYQQCNASCLFTCNPITGNCELDAKGQIKSACDQACFKTYSCDRTIGKCIPDATSTQTESACNNKPCLGEWLCDDISFICRGPIESGNQTKKECTDSCGFNKWKCDHKSGTCKQEPSGTKTENECTDSCVVMYSCDISTGQCYTDVKGTMTAQQCVTQCQEPRIYQCDSSTGQCFISQQGTMTSQECISQCQEPKKYKCDPGPNPPISGDPPKGCIVSTDGTGADKATCEKTCTFTCYAEYPSTGPPSFFGCISAGSSGTTLEKCTTCCHGAGVECSRLSDCGDCGLKCHQITPTPHNCRCTSDVTGSKQECLNAL